MQSSYVPVLENWLSMTIPNNRSAYEDLYNLFEQALASPKGVRVPFADGGIATHMRMRMNKARAIDRAHNADIYPEDNPMHGKSAYDGLVFRLNGSAVIIEKVEATVYDVEELE